MSVDEGWQEKLANSKIGRKSALYLLAAEHLDLNRGLVLRAQNSLSNELESRNPDIRELFGRDAVEIAALKQIKIVVNDRSGDALKRDEEQGHLRIARESQTRIAPSSPANPYVHPSLSGHTENGSSGAGRPRSASQGQNVIARPAATPNAERVRTDGEWGQRNAANKGQRSIAPSSSVSMLGHNNPPKSVRPAIDPKRLMQAQQANKAQLAEAISDVWKLSDGKQVCKLPFYELKRRDLDGVASRVLRDAAQKKYANLDETRSPQDLLSESELKDCFDRVKQLRIAETA